MTPIAPIASVPDAVGGAARPGASRGPGGAFATLLLDGVDRVNDKLVEADRLTRAFALNDSVPLHRVTLAIEEASSSFQLLMQVRTRIVDALQQFSQMQV